MNYLLTNYHTHSTYCDGKDSLEEMIQTAVEKGFHALGFSGHGYTKRDSSFCMRDTEGYIAEVRNLQEKYADKLQIYLGVEEDLIYPADRSQFDYIIGSCHYIIRDGRYYSVDGSPSHFRECLDLFDGDPLRTAQAYFDTFCAYIVRRKPDIIGHFDLITKFDEQNGRQLLDNDAYKKLAYQYLDVALASDCIFEVNTGAIARGMRTTPYPSVDLLYKIQKAGGKVILSSDCHDRNMLDCFFYEAMDLLRQIGFQETYVLYDGCFRPESL